ncbi:MAG: DNA gyrase subunit A, partial [Ruminiclostridium sp.]|nr:DNA gyrase subunit A [Ruminiclostridium sp.]
DESRQEPKVLPTRFPNLLVNGSSGIAVGMATNIPPHNLNEVIDAALCVLDDPEATLADLMEHIKGPDFPTKGIIMGRAGIRAAYATGRGRVTLRARTEFEEYGRNHERTRIIVTELPYQVNKRMLIASIAEHVKEKRIEGISDIRDETDRSGMRIVIELKHDATPQLVLNHLLTQTQMQITFAVNMLALVNQQRQPKILSLREILDEYLTFQEEVITRRTQYDKRKAEERAHLIRGLLIAQDNIDEVIQIIRSSYDNARERLMQRFDLDEIQAQAICDMRLIALQGLNREKLQKEWDELAAKIAYYTELLSDREKLRGVMRDELLEIRDKYGDGRLTEIQDVEDEIDIEDLIQEEECVFTLTAAGYMKRLPASTYRAQKRGGKGISAQTLREEDYVDTLFTASSHDSILFFTSSGRVYQKKGYQIPEASRTAKGTHLNNIFQFQPGERVTAMLHGRDYDENGYLFMVTRNGTVKRTEKSAFRNIRTVGLRVLTLEEGDELISVQETDGEQNVLIATHDGMSICFRETDVRPMGRTAVGVRGIKLRDGDFVIGAALAQPGQTLLTITENGFGKRTPIEEYIRTGGEPQHRGGFGLKGYQITEKTGPAAGIKVVTQADDILLISDDGTIIRMAAEDVNIYGRTAQGVKVMRLTPGSRVIALARTEREEDAQEGGEENEEQTGMSEEQSGKTTEEQE